MPASGYDMFCLQDARNNFHAMRPAPVCVEANQALGQCQPIHVSTNCYYGYHEPKALPNNHVHNDCEMMEASPAPYASPLQANARKRSASDEDHPVNKRLREEVQKEKSNDPETIENRRQDKSSEDLFEKLYWNTHGGNIYVYNRLCEL